MLVEVFFGRIDERAGQQRGHRRASAALLPGPVPAGQAGRRRRRAGPRAPAAGPGADRALRRGGARCPPAAAAGAAQAPGRPRLGGRDLVRRTDRSHRPRQQAATASGLRVVRPRDGEPAEFLAGADVAVLASGGVRAAPGVVRKAFAAGAVPVVSDLQLYRELVGEGERGLLFPLGDVLTLTAQVERLCRDTALRERLGVAARDSREGRPWAQVTDEVEAVYHRLTGRRQDPKGNPEIRARLRGRDYIHCRPAHAHRSLAGLRDPGGTAPRDRQGAGAGRDRDHGPQRDLGGAARPVRSPSGSGGSR